MSSEFDPDVEPVWLAALAAPLRSRALTAGVDDDDCAVLAVEAGQVVVTTDYLNASPIGVELDVATLEDLGFLLTAVNASDLLGSGAVNGQLAVPAGGQ